MITLIFIELYAVAFGALVFALGKLWRARRKYRFKKPQDAPFDDQYPSVSVCLPARNETNAMTECLERVLASDYPKLEVIVLDDHSSDNTSHLIRAFAHAGVRFIQGESLPSDWLGKNFALETLAENASGKLVLFMDVDTRLEPHSIRLMVEQMSTARAHMMSVVPQRYDTSRPSAWFSTLRFFWELVLDSRVIPGVSSSAWLIDRRLLMDELGGFSSWRDEVQPESHIAAEMMKTDEYALIISTPELGVHYEKKWSSQIETSRRLLLPRFGNSIISVLLGAGFSCAVVLAQLIIVFAIIEQSWVLLAAQLVLGILAQTMFMLYYALILRSRWWLGFFVAPYVAWQELYLMIASAVGYKRGTITWKGRTVGRPTRKRTLL